MDWWFDPARTYADNVERGPFGAFAGPAREYLESGSEQTSLLGHQVNSPFGIAAGPLPTARHCAAAFAHGFDVNVYKTVRSRAVAAHSFPNTLAVRVDGNVPGSKPAVMIADSDFGTATTISNSYGVPSPHPDQWQPDMAAAVDAAGDGQLLVASFQGTRTDSSDATLVADYAATAALVTATGAQVLEMNLSCPNEGTSQLLCFDPPLAARIAAAVREQIADRPLIAKIAYFPENQLLEHVITAIAPFIDAIAAVNTLPARLVNERGQQALPGAGREVAGVCGAGVQWAGLEMTRRLHQIREELASPLAIVGVGGVMDVADYRAYRHAGADAVMSATGAMRNPGLGAAIRMSETTAPTA